MLMFCSYPIFNKKLILFILDNQNFF